MSGIFFLIPFFLSFLFSSCRYVTPSEQWDDDDELVPTS